MSNLHSFQPGDIVRCNDKHGTFAREQGLKPGKICIVREVRLIGIRVSGVRHFFAWDKFDAVDPLAAALITVKLLTKKRKRK